MFILEYEREIGATVRRYVAADLYRTTGEDHDHIEFFRSGGAEPVIVVRRSSVITIERSQPAEHPDQQPPAVTMPAPAGPVEAAARASAASQLQPLPAADPSLIAAMR